MSKNKKSSVLWEELYCIMKQAVNVYCNTKKGSVKIIARDVLESSLNNLDALIEDAPEKNREEFKRIKPLIEKILKKA